MRDENQRKTCACNYASEIDLNVFALYVYVLYVHCECVCIELHIQCNSLAYMIQIATLQKEYDETLSTVSIRIPAYSYSSSHQITLTYILYYTPFYIYDMRLCGFYFFITSSNNTAITHYVHGAISVVDAFAVYLSHSVFVTSLSFLFIYLMYIRSLLGFFHSSSIIEWVYQIIRVKLFILPGISRKNGLCPTKKLFFDIFGWISDENFDMMSCENSNNESKNSANFNRILFGFSKKKSSAFARSEAVHKNRASLI